jgi:Flp pilus assembly protein TadG
VESDEFEATMQAIRRISLLLDFFFAIPFLSRGGSGIGAVAVVLLLALLIFGIIAFGIGLRDRRKPPFPMGDRDA